MKNKKILKKVLTKKMKICYNSPTQDNSSVLLKCVRLLLSEIHFIVRCSYEH